MTATRTNPVVEAYRAALPAGDVGEMDISPVDRTGVPVVSTDFAGSQWRAAACGYGWEHEQARIGGYGELAEALVLRRELRGRIPRTASYAELRAERGASGVADPLTLVLPAGSDYGPDRPLHWLTAVRWRTGEEVLVPSEFCASETPDLPAPPPGDPLITVVTNGSGAGDTAARAVAHGLLELLQRDGNAVCYRAMDQGLELELDDVRDSVNRALLARFADVGIEVLPKLASTQFGLTNLYVVGADSDDRHPTAPPIALTACGEAVHRDREVALRKALLEYASSRARKLFAHGPLEAVRPFAPQEYWQREMAHPVAPQETRALEAMREWSELSAAELRALLEPTVLARCSSTAFSTLPTVAPGAFEEPEALLTDLLDRLADFDVLVVLAPTPTAVTAKVIVPGLEVETMSYGRIGERGVAKLLAAGSPLVGIGPPPHPGAPPVPLTDDARERLGGPAWLDVAAVRDMVGELYPLYREPARHALARSTA